MENSEVLATLALSLVPGVGPQRLRLIIATFGSAQAALAAPQAKLPTLEGIGRAAPPAFRGVRVRGGARVRARLAARGPRVLILGRPNFPPQLEEIPEPPSVL